MVVVWHAVYLLCSVAFVLIQFEVATDYDPAGFDKLTNFIVPAPYAYRVLVPSIGALLQETGLSLYRIYQATSIAALYGVFVFFALILHHWFDRRLAKPLALCLLLPLVANYILLRDYIYPYDLPSMFFFVLGLWLLIKDRYTALVAVVALATMNRETSLILVMCYFFYHIGQRPVKEVVLHAAGLGLAWLAVKLPLTLFITDKGYLYERALEHNIYLFTEAFSGHMFLLKRFIAVFGGLHLFWLLTLWVKGRPTRSFDLVIVLFYLALFLTGRFDEERIFNELVPLFTLNFLLTFLAWKERRSARASTS
ncbi:MAG TPA: hypothetical protein VFH43_04980 [Candidatus Kapabacteria bacterium]|nr:hypothetical protein [Candidatus Kapabacteria bacterium]